MQDDLNQNIRSHLEAGCFQQGRGRKKGFHYKERDLFSSLSPLKRKKGDKREKSGSQHANPNGCHSVNAY